MLLRARGILNRVDFIGRACLTYLERALGALVTTKGMFCESIMEWLRDSQEDELDELDRLLLEASDCYEGTDTAAAREDNKRFRMPRKHPSVARMPGPRHSTA